MQQDRSLLVRMLGRLRFRHLQLIEVLARTGNMHRAAVEMSITQPAATKILQDVEDILGVRLFDRSVRGMALTDIGGSVAESAELLLSEAGKLARNVENLRQGGYGSISVGAIMATATDLLPRAISELKRRRALMTVHLVAATSDLLLHQLERRELDLVVGRFTEIRHQAIFSIEALSNEELWAFTAAGSPTAMGDMPSIDALARCAWVLQPAPSPMRRIIDNMFAAAGVEGLSNIVETTSIFATLHLVRSASMAAVLPRSIVEDGIGKGEFVRIPIEIPNPLADYGLILRRGERPPQNVREFVQVLRDVAGTPQTV